MWVSQRDPHILRGVRHCNQLTGVPNRRLVDLAWPKQFKFCVKQEGQRQLLNRSYTYICALCTPCRFYL